MQSNDTLGLGGGEIGKGGGGGRRSVESVQVFKVYDLDCSMVRVTASRPRAENLIALS